jgi:hypothetical protein
MEKHYGTGRLMLFRHFLFLTAAIMVPIVVAEEAGSVEI